MIDVGVARFLPGDEDDFDRLGLGEVTGAPDGDQPHAGAVLRGHFLEGLEAAGDAVLPVGEHADPGGAGVLVLRGEHVVQQLDVHRVVGLVDPQRFGQVVGVVRVGFIEEGRPGLHCGDDFGALARTQFEFSVLPHAIFGGLQQFEQFLDRLPVDLRRLQCLSADVAHAVNATVLFVPARVAEVVLHVADDRVLPIDEVEGAVRPRLHVHGAEVRIGAAEDRFEFGAFDAGTALFDLVAQQPLEPDDVRDDQVPVEVVGEVLAGEVFHAAAGARALLVDLRRPAVLGRVIEVPGEERAVVRVGSRAVDDDIPAPFVEDVAMRVGEAEADVDARLLRPRVVAEDGAVGDALGRAVGRLELAVVEGAFLEVNRPARIGGEAVGRVVRVGRIEAVEDPLADIRLAVVVGVFEEQQVRGLSHEDSAVVELEAGRVVQVVGEDGHLVGDAVAVGVLEYQELVVLRLLRFDVRIRRPDGDPEPAFGVPGHLHRVHQFGPFLLVGEERHLQILADGHLVDGVGPAEELVFAAFEWARLIRDDRDEIGGVLVVHGVVFALRRGVHFGVAVRGHRIEHFQLALGHDAIRLPADEAQVGPSAVDGVAVGGAVAEEPRRVAIHRRDAGRLELLRIRGELVGEKRLGHTGCERLVAVACEVNAVDGERFAGVGVSRLARLEEIDHLHLVRRADGFDGGDVEFQPRVDVFAARQVRRLVILERDRREEYDRGGRGAVVFLRTDVLDDRVEFLLERFHTVGPGERFVVAEEGEDLIGLHPAEPFVVAAERGRAHPLVRVRGAGEPADFVAGETHVPDGEIGLGEAALDVGVEPSVVLHPVG